MLMLKNIGIVQVFIAQKGFKECLKDPEQFENKFAGEGEKKGLNRVPDGYSHPK